MFGTKFSESHYIHATPSIEMFKRLCIVVSDLVMKMMWECNMLGRGWGDGEMGSG